ncbi:hypothetical protein [Streptomyces sp. NPDC000410]|uniref:hypothetical protein n=1 Tax=Streptomyces sp. NPDC000410 TaxID=3154254 RepID=UPI00331BF95B
MIVDVVVDGARFTVTERPGSPGVHDFVWQSGPNPGYGFTMAAHGAGPLGRADLEQAARDFLSQVDPATGYLAD